MGNYISIIITIILSCCIRVICDVGSHAGDWIGIIGLEESVDFSDCMWIGDAAVVLFHGLNIRKENFKLS